MFLKSEHTNGTCVIYVVLASEKVDLALYII